MRWPAASYVLALGERRPGEIMVSPQGYLMFSSLAYADRMPAQSLHKDVTAPPEQRDDRKGSPRSTFAGKLLTADLLAVLGQHANSQASYGLGQPYGSPQEEANALRLQRVGVDLTLLHLSPSTQQLLVTALDAFLAIRRRAEDFVPLLAIHSVRNCRVKHGRSWLTVCICVCVCSHLVCLGTRLHTTWRACAHA